MPRNAGQYSRILFVFSPFSSRSTLSARIRAVLRRKEDGAEKFEVLRVGEIVMDETAHTVKGRSEQVSLTPIEFDLLAVLMRSPGRVFSRTELADHLTDSGFTGLDSTLNVHIRNLRMKIEQDPGSPRYIETVFGIGYRIQKMA